MQLNIFKICNNTILLFAVMELICSCLSCSLETNGMRSNCLDVNPRKIQLCSSESSRIERSDTDSSENQNSGTVKQWNKYCSNCKNHYGSKHHLPITKTNVHWNSVNSSVILNDGVRSPIFGLGVHGLRPGTETIQAVHWALQEGYRLIDTASRYNNEQSVGEAVRTSGVPREDIFIVTKLYDDDHGYEETLAAFGKSLGCLGLDYVDMYLIHAPVPDKVVPSWRAMIELKNHGFVRSIGVSNFGVHHLEELKKHTSVVPSVNQIELHPFLQEVEVVKYCQNEGIAIQAYSPITRGQRLGEPVLIDIADKVHKTPAQILLRWCIQNGYIALPKSSRSDRIRENANVFDFEIPLECMEKLNGLEEGFRTGKNKIGKAWNG